LVGIRHKKHKVVFIYYFGAFHEIICKQVIKVPKIYMLFN